MLFIYLLGTKDLIKTRKLRESMPSLTLTARLS